MKEQIFWVLYDYGQGGLWAVMRADSASQVRLRYPQLQVFDAPPDTLDAATVQQILATGIRDIDGPASGWMEDLLQQPP